MTWRDAAWATMNEVRIQGVKEGKTPDQKYRRSKTAHVWQAKQRLARPDFWIRLSTDFGDNYRSSVLADF